MRNPELHFLHSRFGMKNSQCTMNLNTVVTLFGDVALRPIQSSEREKLCTTEYLHDRLWVDVEVWEKHTQVNDTIIGYCSVLWNVT